MANLSLPASSPILSNYKTPVLPGLPYSPYAGQTSALQATQTSPQSNLASIQSGYTAPQSSTPTQNFSVPTLTPAQLASQNAANGTSQFNTGPAVVGGAVGSSNVPAPPPTDTPSSSGSPSDALLQAYLETLKPNQAQTDLQNQQANLEAANRQLGINQGISNSNIEGQAIPLGEVTGQEANVAKQYQLQQQSLQSQQTTVQQKLANLQAQRQSGIDVAKAALDYGQKQSEINKPFSVPLGSSVYNPSTGQSSGGVTGADEQTISNAINSGALDPSQITRYNLTSILATLQQDPNHNFTGNAVSFNQAKSNSTQWHQDAFGNWFSTQTKPGASGVGGGATTSTSSAPSSSNNVGYQAGQLTALLQSQGKPTDDASLAAMYKAAGLQGNYVNDVSHNSQLYASLGGTSNSSNSSSSTMTFPRADAASLKTQQAYYDTTKRSFQTATDNLNNLIGFMKTAKINTDSNIPLLNQLQNAVKSQGLDPGAIAAFDAALTGLAQEYSQVLARGGQRSVSTDAEAAALLPRNLTPGQLQQVADRINVEAQNTIAESAKTIDEIKGRASGQTSSTPASSSGGDYQSYLKAIGQ